MTEQTIEDVWMTYRVQVIPKDASRLQLVESRRAFFAGAAGLFGLVVDASENSEDSAVQAFDRFSKELRDFAINEGRRV